jgi:3-hydroxybutyryl-CoA dehydrogenase
MTTEAMNTEAMNIATIGVAGLGLLGRGIAACLLAHGFRVIAFTTGSDTHQRARAYIAEAMQELVDNAGFPSVLTTAWPERYVEAASLQDFAPCNFVIESVVEDFAIKQQVFDEVEAAIAADVPVASNTSALPISSLQRDRKVPGRFLGMHWAEPAYATRFMELIRGEQTTDDAFNRAAELARHIGKQPSLVQKDIPGFIVNRLAYAMYREAVHLLELGVADVQTIDQSFQNACGLWAAICGPFRWIDITGGPALYASSMERVLPTLCNSPELPATLREMMREGRRGVIDGRGFYQYAPEDARRWEQLLHEHAWVVRKLQDQSSIRDNAHPGRRPTVCPPVEPA